MEPKGQSSDLDNSFVQSETLHPPNGEVEGARPSDANLDRREANSPDVGDLSEERVPPDAAKYPDWFSDLRSMLVGMETRLTDAFAQMHSEDDFKEKQLDRLHEELQSYKGDVVQKAVRPLLMSLIKLHGDALRLMHGIRREEPEVLTIDRTVSLFDSFRQEIEGLLSDHGIQTYQDTQTESFDVRRQSSVGTVETTDPSLIGQIAERIRPGFEQGATIFDKERVKVYVGKRPSSSTE